ncbi:hypothetical protein O1611_g3413 [Lasiodiplodia mahajangana]|uniref:Uncharacterized protein n=1 Tax=Lasiodiplodia mahajangana TaxID=1108764 RepID=A0ACC2JS95_9PEZI|nr:hypothetical protein O1611_g3413 [Lasiodiplodia mahajangana]
MDMHLGGPAVPEETDGDQKASRDERRKSEFRLCLAVISCDEVVLDPVGKGTEASNANEGSNANTDVNKSGGSLTEMVYASENDLPSHRPDNVSPSTPQKSAPNGTAAPRAQSTNQKQKNKGNKNRNTKNGVASPGRRQDREIPSLPPQVTSDPIFAGSSFHASPAASALPLPRFLGLAGADSPVVKSKGTEAAYESSPTTDSDDGSPVDEPVPRNEESPLEFFFRADRAEKARVRRASSANIDNSIAHSSAQRPVFTGIDSSPSMPTNGPDSNSRLPVGPAFSTPYQERIRIARSQQNSERTTPIVNRNLDPNSSEALKRYLFTGQFDRGDPHQLSPHSSQSLQARQVAQQQQMPVIAQQHSTYQALQRSPFSTPNPTRGGFQPSVLAGHAPRAQPMPPVHMDNGSSPRPDHILALEGNLRRVLKLDSLS